MTQTDTYREEALRRRFVRGCLGKRGYSSKGRAMLVKDFALRKHKGKAWARMAGCEPYECVFCGDWHLGHP